MNACQEVFLSFFISYLQCPCLRVAPHRYWSFLDTNQSTINSGLAELNEAFFISRTMPNFVRFAIQFCCCFEPAADNVTKSPTFILTPLFSVMYIMYHVSRVCQVFLLTFFMTLKCRGLSERI